MLYQIDNKYYVRVGKDFTEVEIIVKGNDIDLKPTTNKVENNGNIEYKEIDFQSNKENLIKEFSKPNKFNSEETVDSEPRRTKYSSR